MDEKARLATSRLRGFFSRSCQYLRVILQSPLYLGVFFLGLTTILVLGGYLTPALGIIGLFSLLWFMLFHPLFADGQTAPATWVNVGAYLFTGAIGPLFSWNVEAFWYHHGMSAYLGSPVLAVAIPSYVLVVGVTEELAKQMIVLLLLASQKILRIVWSPRAYMLFGVSSGLGFSLVENISYAQRGLVFKALENTMGPGTLTAITRALYTPFLHAVWAGIAAYGIGVLANRGTRWRLALALFVTVAVFHGTYDAALGHHPNISLTAVVLSYLLFLILLVFSSHDRPRQD